MSESQAHAGETINRDEWPEELLPRAELIKYLDDGVEVARADGNPAATAIAGSLWVSKGDNRVRVLNVPESLDNAVSASIRPDFLVRPVPPSDDEG